MPEMCRICIFPSHFFRNLWILTIDILIVSEYHIYIMQDAEGILANQTINRR